MRQRGTPGMAAGRLEQRADLTHRIGQLVVPHAAERRGPAGRCHESQEHPQGGGLAGAVRPEQGGHLTRQCHGADVVDGDEVAERLGQAVQLDGACRHSSAPATAKRPRSSATDRTRTQTQNAANGMNA